MELRRDVFQAIADPTRRQILSLVADKPQTPGSLATYFGSTRQTISRHIQILVACGLLKHRKSGREITYHFNPDKFREVSEYIQPFRKFWDENINTLEVLMEYYVDDKPDS